MAHVTRRQFLAGSAVAALGTGAGALALSRRKKGTETEPVAAKPKLSSGKKNVIVLITDSMRYDAMSSFYDKAWVKTPNLDNFVNSAVKCSNAFLCSWPTVLARHDILTATPTCTYKQWSSLAQSTLTLPVVLKSAGVHTALACDTYAPYTDAFNYQRGFRDFMRIHGQAYEPWVKGDVPFRFPCDKRKLRDPDGLSAAYFKNVTKRRPGVEEDWFCAQTSRAAIDWLKKNHASQPFFLMVDIFDPHEPWDPPRRFVNMYGRDYHGEEVQNPRYDLWRNFLTEPELKHCRALYAAEATMADEWAGRFLETVRDLHLFDNTMILYLSDHGSYIGDHGYIGKGISRDHSLKDDLAKNKVYENFPLYPEMCRIPMAAYYPGCKPGTTVNGLVQPVNIAATVLDYLGIKKPKEFTEASAWGLIKGDQEKIAERVLCAPCLSDASPKFTVTPRPTDRPSITDGRWLLIYACAGWADELMGHPHNDPRYAKRTALLSRESLTPRLYDLHADPGCEKDLFGSHRDVAVDLHKWLVKYLEASPMEVRFREYFWDLEPESRSVGEAG
jgi:arylsulfatase A-like enzyme